MLITDNNVVECLRARPNAALKWMYSNYHTYICSVVYRMVNNKATAEDIAQDVFFELWKKRDSLNININFKAYIRRAAVNKTLNHIRAKKVKFEEEDNAVDVSTSNYTTVEYLEAEELKDAISKGIDGLPERCRIVFGLSRFENMSYQEISDKLEISRKTVENQISKALKILKSSVLMVG